MHEQSAHEDEEVENVTGTSDDEVGDALETSSGEGQEPEVPQEGLRRSNRSRKLPEWMRGQEYCWSQQHVENDWTRKASFLLTQVDSELFRDRKDDVASALLQVVTGTVK